MSRIHERHVLISGASSGIGAALARHYARKNFHLTLWGRNTERLARVGEICDETGTGEVATAEVDVTDRKAVAEAVAKADAAHPLTLVFANAGVSGGTAGGGEGTEQAERIFTTNIIGVSNTVIPAIEAMRKRGEGQVGIVASLAGYRGMPGAPAYSASKAAAKAYAEALRGAHYSEGIKVSAICPGFVKTPLTDTNTFRMPFLMDAESAAGLIAAGLARNKAVIAFPPPTHAVMATLAMLPAGLAGLILRRLPEKS